MKLVGVLLVSLFPGVFRRLPFSFGDVLVGEDSEVLSIRVAPFLCGEHVDVTCHLFFLCSFLGFKWASVLVSDLLYVCRMGLYGF